jgi:hypothetical protein
MRRNAHIYATDAQIQYLTALRNEAFAHLYKGEGCVYFATGWEARILKSEASTLISQLKAAKQRKWDR